MSDRPLVSVVMPVYNAGAYLDRAVASIFAQTLTDWELIAVDDASTDGSWEYLQRIDDPRVRVLRNDRNMKQSYTQNRGIDLARGKYVARMDADDLSMPTRLETQVGLLESRPEIDMTGSGDFQVTASLELIATFRPPATHAEITRWATVYFPVCHGTQVGKTEWYRQWRADPKVRLAQDFEFLFRSHLASTFANVPSPLYIYRYAGGTYSLNHKVRSVYYKCYALAKNGFRMGIPLKTLFGFMTLAPRPFLYAMKKAVGSNTGLTKGRSTPPSEEDRRALAEGLRQLAAVQVPLKEAVRA